MRTYLMAILILLWLSIAAIAFGAPLSTIEDDDNSSIRIQTLEQITAKLKNDNTLNKIIIRNLLVSIDSLKAQIVSCQKNIDDTSASLGFKIDDTETRTQNSIKAYSITMSKRTIGILIVFIVLFSLFLLIIFLIVRRLKSNKSQLYLEIVKTRQALEEEGLNLDNKLVELIDKQLYALDNSNYNEGKNASEIDHSLALKVADEIIRIQMNLAHMDRDIKGHKKLSRSVKAILDNFNDYGYEIPNLLDTIYTEYMNVAVTMVPDENLAHGTQIFTKIVKPKVLYKGVIIQAGQAIVSYND